MRVFIQAKTNAKTDSVEEIDQQHFKVCTRELPIDGRANLAIIEILAEYFDIPKTNIKILSGFGSKQKVFEIDI